MQRRHFTTALLFSAMAPLAVQATPAAPRSATFEAEQDGVVTRLTLAADAGRVEGQLQEGELQLQLRGTLQGPALTGQLHEPALGLALLQVRGTWAGDTLALTVQPVTGGDSRSLLMRRQGAAPQAAAAPGRAPSGAIDPRLVGQWRRESHINSPGGSGFASFSTVRTLELTADGRLRQWLRSAGGGGHWSHRSGPELELSGQWQVRGDQLWVKADGQGSFVAAARVRLVDGRLVVESRGGRQVWHR